MPSPPDRLQLTVQDQLQLPERTLELRRAIRMDHTTIGRQEYVTEGLPDSSTGRHDLLTDKVDIWGLVDSERTTWELRYT
jgi:hypothetical protein